MVSAGHRSTLLGCLLIAEELHGRVWDNTGTICAISFEQSPKALSPPDILQSLNCTTVFYVMWILNLSKIVVLHDTLAQQIMIS